MSISGSPDARNRITEMLHEILQKFNEIKYAAYRTSSKLRLIQRLYYMDRIPLRVIANVFNRHHLQRAENFASPNELESVISDIYFIAQREFNFKVIHEAIYQCLIDLLLCIYDSAKKNLVPVLSCKIFLALMCQSHPMEKYCYMFNQVVKHNNCLSRKQLQILLKNLVSVIEYIGEGNSFGSGLIAGTIESCFKTSVGSLEITQDNFMHWLVQDPQLLVWVPTMYRLQISESVSHEAKCAVCQIYPMIGLRYHCLRCLSYDVCQKCFFAGLINKGHKLNHPIQEYCYPMTTSQSAKAFLLTLKNMLYKNNLKLQYLPAEEIDSVRFEGLNSTIGVHSSQSELSKLPFKELQSIILQLEVASEKLIPQIENSCRNLLNSQESDSQSELQNHIVKYKFEVEAQLGRLKNLRTYLIASEKFTTIPLSASTPVVRSLSANYIKNQHSDHNFDAITPIRVLPTSSGPKQNSGAKLIWDNYDFELRKNRILWEEIESGFKQPFRSSVSVIPETQDKLMNSALNTKDGLEVDELSTIQSSMSPFQESDHFSRRGFTWLRDSNDKEFEKKNDSTIENLKTGVKEILMELQALSDDGAGKGNILDRVDKEIEVAEKVDSLLREVITGFEKLIEA